MSDIKKEKDLVASLRNQGMTLQAIANKLSKSIYWVNSRLDDKYKPKRVRQTSLNGNNSPDHLEMVANPKLSEEIDIVKKFRESGMTYEQIAAQFNRSIYWVHTRLSKKYTPRVTLNEKKFQESRVIPWLKDEGHNIIGQYVRSESGLFIQEADIISFYEGFLYITEVKVSITHHQLQTAIGQLLIHKFGYEDPSKLQLQITLPKEVRNDNLSDDFLSFLDHEIGIKVCFIS
jgi:transposase